MNLDNSRYEIWFSMFYTHMIYFHKYKRYLDEISEIRQKHHFGKKNETEKETCAMAKKIVQKIS